MRGQTDTLRLAAGECAGRTGKRQIIQTDVHQKFQPCLDLFQHHVDDTQLALTQNQPLEEILRLVNRHIAQAVNVQLGNIAVILPVSQRHRQHLGFQTRPAAIRAGAFHHIFLNILADKLGFGFVVAPFQISHHTLPGGVHHLALVVIIQIFKSHFLGARTVHDQIQMLRRQISHRLIQRKPVLSAQRLDKTEVPAAVILTPTGQRTLPQAQLIADDQQILVHLHAVSQTGAGRTGAVRIVEREHSGGKLLQTHAAIRAGQVLVELQFLLHSLFGAILTDFLAVGQHQ